MAMEGDVSTVSYSVLRTVMDFSFWPNLRWVKRPFLGLDVQRLSTHLLGIFWQGKAGESPRWEAHGRPTCAPSQSPVGWLGAEGLLSQQGPEAEGPKTEEEESSVPTLELSEAFAPVGSRAGGKGGTVGPGAGTEVQTQ